MRDEQMGSGGRGGSKGTGRNMDQIKPERLALAGNPGLSKILSIVVTWRNSPIHSEEKEIGRCRSLPKAL